MIAWSESAATMILAGAYLGLGAVVATVLSSRGQPVGSALAALAAWPLMLPLLRETPTPPRPRTGPFADTIAQTFAALATVVAEGGDPGIAPAGELEVLQEALFRADERLGLVDRWLATDSGVASAGAQRQAEALRRARDHAASEIEAVLAGLTELRYQVGLVTLAGQNTSVHEQLAALRSRLAALDEVGGLG